MRFTGTYSIKHAIKPVPSLANVGVPHGDGYWLQNFSQMSGGGQEKVSND